MLDLSKVVLLQKIILSTCSSTASCQKWTITDGTTCALNLLDYTDVYMYSCKDNCPTPWPKVVAQTSYRRRQGTMYQYDHGYKTVIWPKTNSCHRRVARRRGHTGIANNNGDYIQYDSFFQRRGRWRLSR